MLLQTNSQLQSPLFKLPTEIRLMIYRYGLLRRRGDIKIGKWCGPSTGEWVRIPQKHLTMMPLLRVCRKVYAEAIYVLYGENDFRFYFPRHGLDFFNNIGIEPLKAMRGITVHFDKDLIYDDENGKQRAAFFKFVTESMRIERLRLGVTLEDFDYGYRQHPFEPEKWHEATALKHLKNVEVECLWYIEYTPYYREDDTEEDRIFELKTRKGFRDFMEKLEAFLLRDQATEGDRACDVVR